MTFYFLLINIDPLIPNGTVSRIFDLWFFSSNCTPGSTDAWAKMVLHIDSNSLSNSIQFDDENQLCAMPHSRGGDTIFFLPLQKPLK
jgi:hypothetical protein